MFLSYIGYFSLFISIFLIGVLLFYYRIDRKKYENFNSNYRPNISVIIPYYNDKDSVENTIKSIINSYDKEKLDIILINDCSDTENSKEIYDIHKKYNFRLIENKINKGKARSLNENVKFAKYEILLFLDSDMIISSENINAMLDRLYDKTDAVSCPYKPIEKGFFGRMQQFEYVMFSYLPISYNKTSAINLRGGNILTKKSVFLKVKGFSSYAFTEDLEYATKLNQIGYRVQQTNSFILSSVPNTFITRWKQKLRWNMGGFQCVIWYPKIWFNHRIYILFLVSFSIFNILFAFRIWHIYLFAGLIINKFNLVYIILGLFSSIKLLGLIYLPKFIMNLVYKLGYSLLSIPFIIKDIHSRKKWYHIFWIIPFSIIYMPIYSFVGLVGFIKGIRHLGDKKKVTRSW